MIYDYVHTSILDRLDNIATDIAYFIVESLLLVTNRKWIRIDSIPQQRITNKRNMKRFRSLSFRFIISFYNGQSKK